MKYDPLKKVDLMFDWKLFVKQNQTLPRFLIIVLFVSTALMQNTSRAAASQLQVSPQQIVLDGLLDYFQIQVPVEEKGKIVGDLTHQSPSPVSIPICWK